MDECELVTFVTAVTCALSKNCSEDELSLLASVFSQLGDTIATIWTKREICDTQKDNNKEIDNISS